jgi:hypothetical protein
VYNFGITILVNNRNNNLEQAFFGLLLEIVYKRLLLVIRLEFYCNESLIAKSLKDNTVIVQGMDYLLDFINLNAEPVDVLVLISSFAVVRKICMACFDSTQAIFNSRVALVSDIFATGCVDDLVQLSIIIATSLWLWRSGN